MDMIPVRSSAIRAIGYEPATQQMRIKFNQGHTYNYCRVPQSVFDGLKGALSKGHYYDAHIKDRYHC
jgi:hypothetical protein